MSDQLSVATLLKLAVSKDAEIRANATEGLAKVPSFAEAEVAAALPSLIDALANRDERVARSAVHWLIAIGAPAVLRLRERLGGLNDQHVQHKVLLILAQLGPVSAPALPEIRACLSATESHVCAAAAQVLLEIGAPAAQASTDLRLALDHWDADVRAVAAKALAKLGIDAALREPAVLSRLIELLADEADNVRRAAVEAVGAMGEMAVPWLTSLIAQKDERRAIQAATGDLASTQEAASADRDRLTPEELRNWSWRVWQRLRSTAEPLIAAAVEALGRIDVHRDDVLQTLGTAASDRNPAIQAQAIKALGRRGPRATSQIPTLVELLADGDDRLQAMILDSLENIAKDWAESPGLAAAATKLVERLKSSVSHDAASAVLARIGVAAVPALIEGLRLGDRVVREASALVLQRIGPPAKQAVATLESVARNEDESGFAREAARRALDAIGS